MKIEKHAYMLGFVSLFLNLLLLSCSSPIIKKADNLAAIKALQDSCNRYITHMKCESENFEYVKPYYNFALALHHRFSFYARDCTPANLSRKGIDYRLFIDSVKAASPRSFFPVEILIELKSFPINPKKQLSNSAEAHIWLLRNELDILRLIRPQFSHDPCD